MSQITGTQIAVISQPVVFGVQMYCAEVVGFGCHFFPTREIYLLALFDFI